jgi:hypothetical protein
MHDHQWEKMEDLKPVQDMRDFSCDILHDAPNGAAGAQKKAGGPR